MQRDFVFSLVISSAVTNMILFRRRPAVSARSVFLLHELKRFFSGMYFLFMKSFKNGYEVTAVKFTLQFQRDLNGDIHEVVTRTCQLLAKKDEAVLLTVKFETFAVQILQKFVDCRIPPKQTIPAFNPYTPLHHTLLFLYMHTYFPKKIGH